MEITDKIRGAIEHRRRTFLTREQYEALTPLPVPVAPQEEPEASSTGGLAGPARVLPVGPPTDQGNTPACAGFSMANAILCRAEIDGVQIDPALASKYGLQVYRWAISYNDWKKYPGLSYFPIYALEHEVASQGHAAKSMDELADAIRAGFPVAISVRWWTSLSAPVDGNLTVRVDDNRESYHAICLVGYDPEHDFQHMPRIQRERKIKQFKKKGKKIPPYLLPAPAPGFLIRNSWGEKWGLKGTAWIRATDLVTLLARNVTEGAEIGNAFYASGWSPVQPKSLYQADSARHGE